MPISKTNLFAIRFKENQLIILDQTRLPNKISYIKLKNYKEVISAIKQLKIRGAPLIGVAAAYGLALASSPLDKISTKRNIRIDTTDCLTGSTQQTTDLRSYLKKVACDLKSARPTAVNLSWAISRMMKIIDNKKISDEKLNKSLITEAVRISKEERENSYQIGKIGVQLIKNKMTIMTICNTGWLAAPGIGTALGIIYTAHGEGKKISVYVLETRPLLQGARLSVFELEQAKIPYVLITDNMMATVMDKVDIVLVGADRIARNGDTANKIGTLTLAITTKYYNVPFYVVAPTSSFDLTKKTGKDIIIEERDSAEVLYMRKQLVASKNAHVYNPAFDITPNKLITGIITEKGIICPPFNKSIINTKNEKPNIKNTNSKM